MDSSASSRKRARDEGIDCNPQATPNKGRRSETHTSSLGVPRINLTSNSTTETPFKKRSGHMQGHIAQCAPVDYLLKERKGEAKIAVSESIVTHKLLEVVKPRKRTIVNKARNLSTRVAASLETYISSRSADNSASEVLRQECVRTFCAPHNKNVTRFVKEAEMYPAIDALFGYISENICTSEDEDLRNDISVFGQSDFLVSDGDTRLRIDKALRIDFDQSGELEDKGAETKGGNADRSMTATYRNIFAVIEAKVDDEAKIDGGANPEDIADNKERVDATRQLYLYTHNIYFRQHARRFAWGFTVCGSVFQVCLFTHDVMVRSGGIDVATQRGRKELVELLTNMSFCDRDQLGYDPTIFFSETNGRWEMDVFEDDRARRCTVTKVLLAADRAFGRHTRCFHCKTIPESGSDEESKDVLVKDAWAHRRRDLGEHEDARDEAALLRVISDGFRNDSSLANKYPNLWAGGTVQQIGSDNNAYDDSTDHIFAALDRDILDEIPHRVHKRLAMEPLGEPLRTAKVVDETIIAVADAMMVYMAAWQRHNIRHRDISTSNILIRRDPTTGEFLNGALIDFDCAVKDTGNEPRTDQRPNMTGTYPFMSINCLAASSDSDLRDSCVPRTILDDWESVLYVFSWLGTFGINDDDSEAVKNNGRRGELPINEWRASSAEKAANSKMDHLASKATFNRNILKRFYEPSQLQLSLLEPSPSTSVSHESLKQLMLVMRKTLFENKNMSKLGWGTNLDTSSDALIEESSDESSAKVLKACWDAHLDPNDRNPYSRRAQVADRIGNALLDVMIAARTEASDRIEIRKAASE
ncbi:hypothetical protein LPJ53_003475 [Coemansia erecta]|uniref:Fungal-type protein kinase domain-containing protein n=1 Tax=Coemansia erecta TaxID=147472 RepID=A0A9W8CSE3_9FUNG|nr:hypothetical protein LPJ53_003475 [Coemansia erecta]